MEPGDMTPYDKPKLGKDGAAAKSVDSYRLPNPAWAWEHLRRNSGYGKDYDNTPQQRAKSALLASSAEFISEREASATAEKWGLVALADPSLCARDAPVFWRPDVLAGALKVQLVGVNDVHKIRTSPHEKINLTDLNCGRTIFDSADGRRHILIRCTGVWIQLYCDAPKTHGDEGSVILQIDRLNNYRRRLDTVDQLLSLYRSHECEPSMMVRGRESTRLEFGLRAYDIISAGGSHRDVAIALLGYQRVVDTWGMSGHYVEDWTRRLINRSRDLVNGEYKTFLTKKKS